MPIEPSGFPILVVHGNEYDTIAQCHKWMAKLVSDGYDFLLWVNRFLQVIRGWFGIQSNFSLAAYVKFKVKNVVHSGTLQWNIGTRQVEKD